MFALPGLKSCLESVLSSRRPFTAAPAAHFYSNPQKGQATAEAVAMDMASFTVNEGAVQWRMQGMPFGRLELNWGLWGELDGTLQKKRVYPKRNFELH